LPRPVYKKCLDCYTNRGSFWTNSVENLIKETEGNIGVKTRGTCIETGYKSIAIIPIPYKDKNIGLIQLNDFEENRFSKDIINNIEDLAYAIGIVIGDLDIQKAKEYEKKEIVKNNLRCIIKDIQDVSESILKKHTSKDAPFV